MIQTQGVDN